MNPPDSRVVCRRLFVDSVERDVYEDSDGRQWVVGYEGERVYGVRLVPIMVGSFCRKEPAS
jgi:hypothetical protein